LLLLSPAVTGAQLGAADFVPSPEQPVGWRGNGNGYFPGARPVTSWNAKTGQNVVWKVDLPWHSASSPIVVKDRVLIGVDPHNLMCFDADTGKLLWNNPTDQLDIIFAGNPAEAAKVRAEWAEMVTTKKSKSLQKKAVPYGEKYGLIGCWSRAQGNTWATPISDGEFVYTAWASNTAACYRLEDGEIVWMKFWGPVEYGGNSLRKSDNAQSSSWNERWVPSPVLSAGVLITMQGAVLRGVDAASGRPLWVQPLNQNRDVYEEHDKIVRRDGPTGHWGCGTPVVLDVDGIRVVVTSRGRAYRVQDGKVVCPYLGAMADVGGSSPVADDENDIVYFFDYMDGGSGAETKKAWAIKLKKEGPESIKGEVLWSKDLGGTASSPVLAGNVLIANDLVAVNALTGDKLWDAGGAKVGGGYDSGAIGGNVLVKFRKCAAATIDARNGRVVAKNLVLQESDGKKRSPLRSKYEKEMIKRAEQAVKDGVLRYRDRSISHGSWADCYGAAPFFHGNRMYVRTRMTLFCIGPR
jgi:outer membrane protein assembly factor BamB